MKYRILWGCSLGIIASALLAGCGSVDLGGTLHERPAALSGDFSGKDFSGAETFIPVAGNIPGVPESNGKQGRWAPIDREQALYLDGFCQRQLFEKLPSWAQAIVKEGGWESLAVAVGEGGFAAAFPGAEIARYMLGGLGYGFPAGANTGRYRQDTSEKAAQGYCTLEQVWDARARYHILTGTIVVPWEGDGRADIPDAVNKNGDQALPYVEGTIPPMN